MSQREYFKSLSEDFLHDINQYYINGLYRSVLRESGYVIELGLKAAICHQNNFELTPTEGNYKTHNFDSLLHKAGLKDELKKELKKSPKFKVYWSLVSQWNPEIRYKSIGNQDSKDSAGKQLIAIEDKKEGVKRWIEKYW